MKINSKDCKFSENFKWWTWKESFFLFSIEKMKKILLFFGSLWTPTNSLDMQCYLSHFPKLQNSINSIVANEKFASKPGRPRDVGFLSKSKASKKKKEIQFKSVSIQFWIEHSKAEHLITFRVQDLSAENN